MALATMFQLIPEADTTTKGGRTPEPSRNLNTLDRSTLIVSVIVTLIDPFKRNPILIIKAPILLRRHSRPRNAEGFGFVTEDGKESGKGALNPGVLGFRVKRSGH